MTAHRVLRSRSRFRARRGVATIEVALSLPLMLILLLAIFTLGGYWLTQMDATITVRHNAWAGRDAPWKADPEGRYSEHRLPVDGCSSVARILGPMPLLPADRGLLKAEETRTVPLFSASLASLVPDAHAEHYTLGGCWDYRNIPFVNDRHRHLPLHCDKKYRYLIDRPLFDMSGFLTLMF